MCDAWAYGSVIIVLALLTAFAGNINAVLHAWALRILASAGKEKR